MAINCQQRRQTLGQVDIVVSNENAQRLYFKRVGWISGVRSYQLPIFVLKIASLGTGSAVGFLFLTRDRHNDRIFAIRLIMALLAAGLGRSQGGLGIGLAVSKGLIELHGGTLTVESQGRGEGSTFTVLLPIGKPASLTPHNHGVALQAQPRHSGSHRILVVDDNTDAADSLASLLELEGHDVQIAYHGKEALILVKSQAPAVCFLDIGMPDMDGYMNRPGF